MPGLPRLGVHVVDVRDCADLHIKAMTSPKAAGERFIAISDDGQLWTRDIAIKLKAGLGERGKKVPTRSVPSFVVRILGWFDGTIAMVVPELDSKFISLVLWRVVDLRCRDEGDIERKGEGGTRVEASQRRRIDVGYCEQFVRSWSGQGLAKLSAHCLLPTCPALSLSITVAALHFVFQISSRSLSQLQHQLLRPPSATT